MLAEVEFVVDGGTIFAETLDVSQSGLSLETSKPLTIQLRVRIEGEEEVRRAELVWSRGIESGPDALRVEVCGLNRDVDPEEMKVGG
jgi:hypothetical protein